MNDRKAKSSRRSWCCSFSVPPQSPELLHCSKRAITPPPPPNNNNNNKSKSASSFPNSPQSSTKSGGLGLSRMDPRRILSPGRVSPLDPDPDHQHLDHPSVHCIVNTNVPPEPSPKPPCNRRLIPDTYDKSPVVEAVADLPKSSSSNARVFDVRLNLKGKNGGGCLVLELISDVLSENSKVFANLVSDSRIGLNAGSKICRIEVPDVENLGVFKQTIEFMFQENITKRLLKIGVYRAIDILEVSAGIMFNRGVVSCLKYLESVPWTEEEEEKLRSLFTRFKFDGTTTKDILARLFPLDLVDSQNNLAKQLIWSITACAEVNARNELKSLVKGLLCKSSIYQKEQPDLNRDDLYPVCLSCLHSLSELFEDASNHMPHERSTMKERGKTLIERVSRQVDNINWLLEILIEWQMAEEFVDMWTGQAELIKMHSSSSPMVRYEVSRVSAILFIALGTRKLHCKSEARSAFFLTWFHPMLLDFGWLQRCKKGLDMKVLEEATGQALLTLPLKHQSALFMDWIGYFSKNGTESPNLSKAFQVWWRRSFLRGPEMHAILSR